MSADFGKRVAEFSVRVEFWGEAQTALLAYVLNRRLRELEQEIRDATGFTPLITGPIVRAADE